MYLCAFVFVFPWVRVHAGTMCDAVIFCADFCAAVSAILLPALTITVPCTSVPLQFLAQTGEGGWHKGSMVLWDGKKCPNFVKAQSYGEILRWGTKFNTKHYGKTESERKMRYAVKLHYNPVVVQKVTWKFMVGHKRC